MDWDSFKNGFLSYVVWETLYYILTNDYLTQKFKKTKILCYVQKIHKVTCFQPGKSRNLM